MSLPIFNLLRANSANPNKSNPKTNRLPFHIAVKNANAEFVKLLVEYGSNIYEAPLIPTRKGTLPLMLSAAQTLSVLSVEALLRDGLDASFV